MELIRDEWFEILCQKLDEKSYVDSVNEISLFEYYKLANICYPITEYIFKKVNFGYKKIQTFHIVFSDQLESIYNNRYNYNTLKHMNEENEFKMLLKSNITDMYNDLFLNTIQLLKEYNENNDSEEILDNYILNSLMKYIYEILNAEGYVTKGISISVFKKQDLSYILKLINDEWKDDGGTGTMGFYHMDAYGKEIESIIPGEDYSSAVHIGNIHNQKYISCNYRKY